VIGYQELCAATEQVWRGAINPVTDIADIDEGALMEFVKDSYYTNINDGRDVGFGSALAWGICLGVVLERNRQEAAT
jgi:hypothetical protein